jgi:hypothetical protein
VLRRRQYGFAVKSVKACAVLFISDLMRLSVHGSGVDREDCPLRVARIEGKSPNARPRSSEPASIIFAEICQRRRCSVYVCLGSSS